MNNKRYARYANAADLTSNRSFVLSLMVQKILLQKRAEKIAAAVRAQNLQLLLAAVN